LKAFINVDPEKTIFIDREVKKIMSKLAKNKISRDELQRSIDPTLTGIKDLQRTNRYWLNTVLSGSKKHPCQLEWSRTIKKDYALITTSEISRLAKKYFDVGKTATIIIKPE